MAHALGFGTVSVEEKGKAETGAAIMLINDVAHVCYNVMNQDGGIDFYFNGCRSLDAQYEERRKTHYSLSQLL
jgi:hypothetical protein